MRQTESLNDFIVIQYKTEAIKEWWRILYIKYVLIYSTYVWNSVYNKKKQKILISQANLIIHWKFLCLFNIALTYHI